MVKIDTTRRPVSPRWWIESATGAYKGLQGRGEEAENATYTVSTLRGKSVALIAEAVRNLLHQKIGVESPIR